MEKNKLATFVVTSMMAVLAAQTENPKMEYSDPNSCEISTNALIDVKTCNQCNMPRQG